jgi:hypothetical protein
MFLLCHPELVSGSPDRIRGADRRRVVVCLIGCRNVIVIPDDAVVSDGRQTVMAGLIRHPRRPREGTVAIVRGYVSSIVCCYWEMLKRVQHDKCGASWYGSM